MCCGHHVLHTGAGCTYPTTTGQGLVVENSAVLSRMQHLNVSSAVPTEPLSRAWHHLQGGPRTSRKHVWPPLRGCVEKHHTAHCALAHIPVSSPQHTLLSSEVGSVISDKFCFRFCYIYICDLRRGPRGSDQCQRVYGLTRMQQTLAENNFNTSKRPQPQSLAKETRASFPFKLFTRQTVAHTVRKKPSSQTATMLIETKFEGN